MSIGERIKQIRKMENLTLQGFGDRIGKISSSGISKMEKGVNNITDRTVDAVCKEFKINEHWLRTGEGEPYNNEKNKSEDIDEDIEYARLLGAMAAENSDTAKRLMFKIRQLKDGEILAIETLVDSILKEDESSN